MYKELLSTNRVGLIIDTNEWSLGIELLFNLGEDTNGCMIQVSLLCLHLIVAL